MPTINGRACVVNGTPVDKVFSNGSQVYGRNIAIGTIKPFIMGYGIPNTVWNQDSNRTELALPTQMLHAEILPQGAGFYFALDANITYTQSIFIGTDAPLTGYKARVSWQTSKDGHDMRGTDDLIEVDNNLYRLTSTYTWPAGKSSNIIRAFDLFATSNSPFDFTSGTFLYFKLPQLESGNIATPWTPAPEDVM